MQEETPQSAVLCPSNRDVAHRGAAVDSTLAGCYFCFSRRGTAAIRPGATRWFPTAVEAWPGASPGWAPSSRCRRASGQQRAGRPVVARGAKGRNCKSSVVQFLPPILIFFFFSLIYLKLLQFWSCLQAKTGKRFPETSLNKSPAGNWLSPTLVSLVSYMERRVTG